MPSSSLGPLQAWHPMRGPTALPAPAPQQGLPTADGDGAPVQNVTHRSVSAIAALARVHHGRDPHRARPSMPVQSAVGYENPCCATRLWNSIVPDSLNEMEMSGCA